MCGGTVLSHALKFRGIFCDAEGRSRLQRGLNAQVASEPGHGFEAKIGHRRNHLLIALAFAVRSRCFVCALYPSGLRMSIGRFGHRCTTQFLLGCPIMVPAAIRNATGREESALRSANSRRQLELRCWRNATRGPASGRRPDRLLDGIKTHHAVAASKSALEVK